MRCPRIKQGRFSWMTVNQIQNTKIKLSVGNDVQNMTWVCFFTVIANSFYRKANISHFVSPLWKPFPRVRAFHLAFFSERITEGKPFELQVSSCWQGCLTSGSYSAFGKWIHPPKHSFIGRCFFSLLTQMCCFLQWRCVQTSSSFPNTDNCFKKLFSYQVIAVCLPACYLQISRTKQLEND